MVSKDFMPERSRMILMARVGELWLPDAPGISRARLSSRADVSVSQMGPLALDSAGKTLTNHCSLRSPSSRTCTDHPPLVNTFVSQTRHIVIDSISQVIRLHNHRRLATLRMDSSYQCFSQRTTTFWKKGKTKQSTALTSGLIIPYSQVCCHFWPPSQLWIPIPGKCPVCVLTVWTYWHWLDIGWDGMGLKPCLRWEGKCWFQCKGMNYNFKNMWLHLSKSDWILAAHEEH